jgi:ferredoxin
MAPDLPESINNGLTPMMGVEINFNRKICTGCGKCASGSCFVNAIKIEGEKAVINEKKCRVCGRCAETCENRAISVLMSSDAVVHSIERIENLVDVKSK